MILKEINVGNALLGKAVMHSHLEENYASQQSSSCQGVRFKIKTDSNRDTYRHELSC